jgi:hypothetical protein
MQMKLTEARILTLRTEKPQEDIFHERTPGPVCGLPAGARFPERAIRCPAERFGPETLKLLMPAPQRIFPIDEDEILRPSAASDGATALANGGPTLPHEVNAPLSQLDISLEALPRRSGARLNGGGSRDLFRSGPPFVLGEKEGMTCPNRSLPRGRCSNPILT